MQVGTNLTINTKHSLCSSHAFDRFQNGWLTHWKMGTTVGGLTANTKSKFDITKSPTGYKHLC